MKKRLTRVLMGLGVLSLVVGGLAGLWGPDARGVAREASRREALQQQALTQLDARHPFTLPRDGEVLALSEARLDDYLTIRESSRPLVEALAMRTLELQEERAKGKGAPSLTATREADESLLDLAARARAAYIEHLRRHRMSPREFLSLTAHIYELHEKGLRAEKERFRAAEQQAVEKALTELQARMKDGSLSAEQRSALEMKESQYKAWLGTFEKPSSGEPLSEAARATRQANEELVKKHRLRIAKAYDSNFDAFVHESASSGAPSGGSAQDTP
ncbi:hypothetical protein [Myxococcus sp. RHSTA-1-4]|uniref:hypothetical protein n=1 Tax=Myxococcus sp. RHSTA-1-4 TaxID=2874601 RepID=UPI001CBE8412|nr:hypothetical protein [Myxococcus sp. RHSTA-1-4]MBZ4421272.1 hypothetical protein [Myxococcus sp. RHSTA-1-4]